MSLLVLTGLRLCSMSIRVLVRSAAQTEAPLMPQPEIAQLCFYLQQGRRQWMSLVKGYSLKEILFHSVCLSLVWKIKVWWCFARESIRSLVMKARAPLWQRKELHVEKKKRFLTLSKVLTLSRPKHVGALVHLASVSAPLVWEQCTSFALCALLTLTKSVMKVCAVVFCVVIAPVSAVVSFLFVSL